MKSSREYKALQLIPYISIVSMFHINSWCWTRTTNECLLLTRTESKPKVSGVTFDFAAVDAATDLKVAVVAPRDTPRIANDPIVFAGRFVRFRSRYHKIHD